jgi:hypothetical protein
VRDRAPAVLARAAPVPEGAPRTSGSSRSTAGPPSAEAAARQASVPPVASLRRGPLAPADVLRLQRSLGNRAVGRLLSDARLGVSRDFYEYVPTTGKHAWHAEAVTPEYVPVGRKHKGPDDFFSWSVYVKRAASPLEARVAAKVLKAAFPGYQFVTGNVAIQTHEEWTEELETRDRPDDGNDSFSGYTAGWSKPPAQRDVRVHKDRQKLDTLVHELVHVNSVEDFEDAIGKVLNEGITEYLAQHAMRVTGFVPVGHYRDAVPIAEKLAAKVGRDTLVKAWFRGGVDVLDEALTAKGIDLVDVAAAAGHNYIRLPKVQVLDLGSLDLEDVGPLVSSGGGLGSGGTEAKSSVL